MFQALKPVSKRETKGSYSITVIGIILITVIITLGLSVLGVGINAQDGIRDKDQEMPYIPERPEIISHEIPPEKKISADQSIEVSSEVTDGAIVGLCDVPVPNSGCFGPFDTVRGTLTITEENLPTWDALPLCIDDAMLEGYYVIVRSYGGYTPVRGGFAVDQMKDNEIEGFIYMTFEEVTDAYKTDNDCCAVRYWKVTFHLCEDICLDSNHTPVGFEDKTLDKEVYLYGCMTWTGCERPEQEFSVILAHKAMSQ
ncbi:MAG: hypothetical protein ACFE9R_02965 [Candidatus Hermodarchaeota archaeon]